MPYSSFVTTDFGTLYNSYAAITGIWVFLLKQDTLKIQQCNSAASTISRQHILQQAMHDGPGQTSRTPATIVTVSKNTYEYNDKP